MRNSDALQIRDLVAQLVDENASLLAERAHFGGVVVFRGFQQFAQIDTNQQTSGTGNNFSSRLLKNMRNRESGVVEFSLTESGEPSVKPG